MLLLSEALDEGNSYPSGLDSLAVNNSLMIGSMGANCDHDALMRQSAGALDFCSRRAMRNPFADYTMNLTSSVSLLHPPSTMFNRYYNAGETNTRSNFGTNYEVAVDTCVPRPRWCPTLEQKEILESIFESGIRTPSRKLIVEIASHLSKFGNVGEANVFYWFQNRKARAKRKARAGTTSHCGNIDAIKAMEVSSSQSDNRKRRRRVALSDNRPLLNILSTKDHEHVLSNKDAADSIHKSLVSSSASSTSNTLSSSSSSWSSSSYRSDMNLGQDEVHLTPEVMDSFLTPLHMHPPFLDEAYNHAFSMGNIMAEEMVEYFKGPAPPIRTDLSPSTCDNNVQVASSVDDFLLWDDMLAVALFTG